jgi:hypothetical protein
MIAANHLTHREEPHRMNTRPAWGMLLMGALIVIVLFLSPIWLKQFSNYIEVKQEVAPFPDEFYQFSNQAQDLYLKLYDTSRQMAVDLVGARLVPPVDVEEPNLPAVDPNPQLVQELLTGNFVTLNAIRSAQGSASLYRLSDGRTIVRLQNLDAINGPDMHVVLSAYPRPSTKEELDQVPQYQIDLGSLKGNQGNQNYIIEEPAFNVDNYTEGSVVLYSTRYELVFSFAPLSAPQPIPGS